MSVVTVRTAVTLLAVVFAAACTESSSGTGPVNGPTPWNSQFTFGNSSFNTVEVVTFQDGISPTILTDYIPQGSIPNVDLEVFTTHAYLPTAQGINTNISNVSVIVSTTGGSTGEIYYDADFVQRGTVDGQLYDIYQITGWYQGGASIRPTNFRNVNFRFLVTYSKTTGQVLHTSQRTIEIFKRT